MGGEIITLEGQEEQPTMELPILEENPRYVQYGLIGRGTTIISVRRPAGTGWAERLIAKQSWPVARKTPEDEHLRIIWEKLPSHWLQHRVVDMKCSMILDQKNKSAS